MLKTLIALAAFLAFPAAHADDRHHPPQNDGEVRKVDKDAQKITIRHGPLEKLDMPAMTMVFRVQNPAMLDKVAPGDSVRFLAERVNGAITVTRLETLK